MSAAREVAAWGFRRIDRSYASERVRRLVGSGTHQITLGSGKDFEKERVGGGDDASQLEEAPKVNS